MFKSLRNRFLILNMSIISIVMFAAFFAIYLTTYNNIRSSNQDKLKSLSEVGLNIVMEDTAEAPLSIENDEPITYGIGSDNGDKSTDVIIDNRTAHFVSPNYSLSFHIVTDKYGNILKTNSLIDIPDETYAIIAKQAWDNKSGNSPINLDGKIWHFSISPINITTYANDGQAIANEQYQITFLDVTESHETLRDLLITFLIVAFIMLAVIFFVSLYFSNRAIKPIAVTWEKQKQFVADASHELKTPLTIIKSNHGVLLENRKDTIENQMEWIDYIKIGTDRLSKLTNDLLTLANMDNINTASSNEPFNISKTVSNVVQSMEARAIEKGINLSVSMTPDIIVNSDADRVTQVVTILLDNALKYTNNNGWIDVSLTASKRHMVYAVKNSGKGIPKEDLSKIFDRFYRADKSRTDDNGGYGLGLSIAKTIMDKLNGKINVESAENENTTFTFTLEL